MSTGRKLIETHIAEAIGTEIKRYRSMNLMTQKQLGEKTDLTQNMVSQFERGLSMPNAMQIVKIAQACDVKVEDIVKIA